MAQKLSGLRIWMWGILLMVGLAMVALVAVLKGQGFDHLNFEPRLVFTFVILACLLGIFAFFVRNKRENKSDLPNS